MGSGPELPHKILVALFVEHRHIVSSMDHQTAQPSGFHAAGPLGRDGAAVGNALRKTREAWPGLSTYERFEEVVSLVLTALIGLVITAAVINLASVPAS